MSTTTIRSAVAVMILLVVLFALCEMGIADIVAISNNMRTNNKLVGIKCMNGFRIQDYEIEKGNRTVINLNDDDGRIGDLAVPPKKCRGEWEEVDGEFTFVAYSEIRDHNRCRNLCFMELRDFGLYGWNQTIQVWELVYKWPLRPNAQN